MRDSIETNTVLVETPIAAPNWRGAAQVGWRRLAKVAVFFVSIFLFILAITLMKEGAHALAPLANDFFQVTNPLNSLGFGWLFAYVVMSGSPVAAAAITFLDAGVINPLGTFTMITGSRLGASFIVLFIGFIYVLRGRNRATSLSMGLLSLIVTGTTYLAALVVGLFLMTTGRFAEIEPPASGLLLSVTELIFDPLAALFLTYLPRWTLFLTGFGIILVSFSLFDKCLPQLSLKECHVGQMSRLVYQPWVMFLLGATITLISMSVSVSLSILVPLSQRGFVRRENVIPYIMGANITTFVDTLLAALLLNNPAAFSVVLAEMASIAMVSLIILAFFYRRYQAAIINLVDDIAESDRQLALFMGAILIVPIILLLL